MSPHFTDGEAKAQRPAQGFKNTGLQLGDLAPSWSLTVFIYKMGMVTEFPLTRWQ